MIPINEWTPEILILLHMQAAKAQISLCKYIDSPESQLLQHKEDFDEGMGQNLDI